MNFHQVYQSTLMPEMTDHQIVSGLKELHQLYTTQRHELKEDQLTEQMVSSYSLFYLMTNMPKLNFVFDKLDTEIRKKMLELPLMDIGTGPGTYLWPLFELGRRAPTFGIDRSSLMLKQAEKLRIFFFPDCDVHWSQFVPSTFPEKGILMFGNSINEMGVSKAISLIDRFKPEIIFWIEPGTRELSFELLKIRELLGDKGFNVAYPCSSIEGKCPMVLRKEESWCHQIIRMTHDAEVERISQMIKLDRKVMTMHAHLYFKESKVTEPEMKSATLVRFIQETKHSFEWEVCLKADHQNQLYHFEIPKRELSKSQIKCLQKESVGIKFNYHQLKVLTEQKWRVKLMDYPPLN